MERKVTIDDPALDTIVDSVSSLAGLVQNLYDTVYRHRHFTNDRENPDGGQWTTLNDTMRDSDLDGIRDALNEIRYDLEGLRPTS